MQHAQPLAKPGKMTAEFSIKFFSMFADNKPNVPRERFYHPETRGYISPGDFLNFPKAIYSNSDILNELDKAMRPLGLRGLSVYPHPSGNGWVEGSGVFIPEAPWHKAFAYANAPIIKRHGSRGAKAAYRGGAPE
jgi:hypothetical protein